MKKKLYILIGMIIVVAFSVTGCWGLQDIDNRSIVLGIAIDYADEPQAPNYLNSDRIKVTVQLAVPQKLSGGAGQAPPMGQETVWNVSAVGKNMAEAFLRMQQRLQFAIFLGHVRVLIISKEVARDGIRRYLNYFRNNPHFRRRSYLLISDQKAVDILKTFPKTGTIQAVYLMNMLDTAINNGTMPKIHFMDFVIRMVESGIDPVTILVSSMEDAIKQMGVAVFRGDKMVGKLDIYETWNYNLLAKNKFGGMETVRDVEMELGMVSIELNEAESTVKPELLSDGRYQFTISSQIDGWTVWEEDDTDYTNPQRLKALENRATQEFIRELEALTYKVQKQYQADIFGFGELVKAYLPADWKKVKDWRADFFKAELKIDLRISIRRIGMSTFKQN